MNHLTALLLGIIQGLTEFLPISSSGHLFILEKFMGLEVSENPFFDIVLHAGTLIALLSYFWKDWVKILKSAFSKRKSISEFLETELGYIVIALIPLVLLGIPMKLIYPSFRNVISVSVLFFLVGLILIIVSIKKFKHSELSKKNAFLIGLAQIFAVLPGVSRSGVTIATGMARGIDKEKSARFSFLIAFPAISAAAIISLLDVTAEYAQQIGITNLLIGFFASFVSSLLCVSFFLKFIRRYSLKIFGIYLIVISIILLTLQLW